MLRVVALCLLLAACGGHSAPPPAPAPYRPIGSELFRNPAFTAWSKGSPRTGGFGQNAFTEQRGDIDAADAWVAKWTVSAGSRLTASKVADGMRYDVRPAGPDESFYVRQYIGDVPWLLGKKFRLSATFDCSPNVSSIWWYLHFRWNLNEEDPAPVIIGGSGSTSPAARQISADIINPAANPGKQVDVSGGLVPSLIMQTKGTDPAWCVFHKMSAVQVP